MPAMSGAMPKPLPVCEACRIRKVRCDPFEETCRECRRAGMECIRTSSIRFKHHSGNDAGEGQVFPARQVWALPKTALRYHDETPRLVGMYDAYGPGYDTDAMLPTLHVENDSRNGIGRTQASLDEPGSSTHQTQSHPIQAFPIGGANLINSPSTQVLAPAADTSAQELVNHGPQSHDSPWAQSVGSDQVQSPGLQSAPPLSESEAMLLRNFSDNMALWADGTDPGRSFELEATSRALTNPVLLYAICAFSSRHVNRNRIDQDTMALEYQSMCLQLLIPAISAPKPVNESTLAAVAILRQNEEMDEDDERFHLEGVSRILENKYNLLSAGGLGEATAWLCLREEIYVSLSTQTPLRSSLATFKNASWVNGNGDAAWANRMVLLLGEILSHAFVSTTDKSVTDELKAKLRDWDHLKPISFRPIHYVPRKPAMSRYLPEIWMLGAHHAVGLQYYHIAQLVLAVSNRMTSSNFLQYIEEHRAVEQQVRHHLLHVVGIATSNERAQNAWFTAHHCLAVWGGCLRRHGDQQASLAFLHMMQSRTGWRVQRLVEKLKYQWGEDSE